MPTELLSFIATFSVSSSLKFLPTTIGHLLFRSFLWLVSELANVWDSQVELAGSMVGDGSEVDEVFESPGHSLC